MTHNLPYECNIFTSKRVGYVSEGINLLTSTNDEEDGDDDEEEEDVTVLLGFSLFNCCEQASQHLFIT